MTENVMSAVQVVEADTVCRRCGYNLRGLAVTGKCPECGAVVEISIHGNLLRYASVPWLEKVKLGFTLMLWGILVQLVGGTMGAFLMRGNAVLSQGVMLLAGSVSLAGAWLITEPDPADRQEAAEVTARRLVRVALLATLAVSLVQMAFTATGVTGFGRIAVVVAMVIGGIAGLVGELARLSYIGRLADRIPNSELGKRARSLRTAYGVVMTGMLIASVLMMVLLPAMVGGGGSAFMFLGCVMAVFGLAALVIAIMQIVLLFRMRSQMETQIVTAKTQWAIAEAQPHVSTEEEMNGGAGL